MSDPVTTIVVAAVLVGVLSVAAYWVGRRREVRDSAARSDWLRRERERSATQREEMSRLARRIIASSTTRSIAGFTIVRQIEAVFTDGHATPPDAVEALKAVAAAKGANALINLTGERQGTGKCSARADAVMVRPIQRAGSPSPASAPGAAASENAGGEGRKP